MEVKFPEKIFNFEVVLPADLEQAISKKERHNSKIMLNLDGIKNFFI
jgi:hypothetical protein